MKIILLCGGQGSRLWPLSYPTRTKPFIPLFESPNGKQSTIQRIWSQLGRSGLSCFVHFLIGANQEAILLEQLGSSVPYMVEPEGRGTYPAVVYAAAFLRSKDDPEETIFVMPADLYVDDSFYGQILELEAFLHQSGAQLGLLGNIPEFPSDQYGYIVPEQDQMSNEAQYRKIERFIEKPSRSDTRKLIEAGALWNCGIVGVRLSYLAEILEREGYVLEMESIRRRFLELEQTSFDYKVLEEAENMIVLPYKGLWKDIGGWDTLTEVWVPPIIESLALEDSCNVTVINETELTVKISGVDDLLVVISSEGILVRKKIKQFAMDGHKNSSVF